MKTKQLQLNIFNEKNLGINKIINGILYGIIVFLVLLIILLNLITMCVISGESMLNTLHHNDNVLLLKTKNIDRGDIIVIKTNKPIIKRVIALSHDKLIFAKDNNQNVGVYLNTSSTSNTFNLLSEDYIAQQMQANWFSRFGNFYNGIYQLLPVSQLDPTLQIDTQTHSQYIIDIQNQSYFVMGDNREISEDSKSIGTIKKHQIYGKMVHILQKNSFLERFFLFLYGEKQAQ